MDANSSPSQGPSLSCGGVPHAVYHLLNTDVLDASDIVLNLLALAAFVVLGGGLVYAANRLPDTTSRA